jgi:hypothetical protein
MGIAGTVDSRDEVGPSTDSDLIFSGSWPNRPIFPRTSEGWTITTDATGSSAVTNAIQGVWNPMTAATTTARAIVLVTHTALTATLSCSVVTYSDIARPSGTGIAPVIGKSYLMRPGVVVITED